MVTFGHFKPAMSYMYTESAYSWARKADNDFFFVFLMWPGAAFEGWAVR